MNLVIPQRHPIITAAKHLDNKSLASKTFVCNKSLEGGFKGLVKNIDDIYSLLIGWNFSQT